MVRNALTALSIAALLTVAACGGEANAPTPATPATPATGAAAGGEHKADPKAASTNVKPNGEAKVGDTTKCPVSGEEFVVEATSPKVEYQGKTYYTCCAGCKKKLEAEPAKYLNKS